MADRDKQSSARMTSLVPMINQARALMTMGRASRDRRIAPSADWFGPMDPLPPSAPDEVKGRQFDYPYGYNTQLTPRANESAISFRGLRAFADSFDVLRIIIENRKDKICGLPWVIKPKDDDVEPDARCEAVTAFLLNPMPNVLFQDWLRMILEDAMVIDAVSIYPRRTLGGDPFSLDLIDSATINRLIDQGGRTPLPPGPAFQQVLKGLPAVNYTSEELIYKMRNPRTWKLYGFSKVEQIIVTVNIALRRQAFTLQYYTEGSVPDALFTLPKEWNAADVKTFQTYFDDKLSGIGSEKRRMRFMPEGKLFETKQPPLKDMFDEWLARVVCFCFGVSPAGFTAQQNRATAESAAEQAESEGIAPWLQYVKAVMDQLLLTVWGYTDLEFDFDNAKEIDPKLKAEIDDKNIRNGSATVNEIRVARGEEPRPGGEEPFIVLGSTVMLLSDIKEASAKSAAPDPTPVVAGPGGKPLPGAKKPSGPKPTSKQAEKFEKAAKLKPIDRDRKSISKARAELTAKISELFKRVAEDVARQITEPMSKISDAELDGLLAGVDLNSLGALEDVIEEYIKAADLDGLQQALKQVKATAAPDALALANDRAVAYAKAQSATLVRQVTETTREKLRSTVASSLEEGASPQQLAKDIQESYAFSAERAAVIARTELAKADVEGNLNGYKASGVVEGKIWLTANDDLVSEDCVKNAQQGAVSLDGQFSSGVQGPPDHPNCRCDIAPITD